MSKESDNMKGAGPYRYIDFMRFSKAAGMISTVLLVVSLGSLVFNGLNWGLDFTGGTQVEVRYSQAADLDEIRDVLEEEGFENYEATLFGSDYDVSIRIQDTGSSEMDPEIAAQTGDRVVALLQERSNDRVTLVRSEYVGSVVGEELREMGGLGMLVSAAIMMIYIAMRFQFKFGVATVAALFEDVIIVLGAFSVFQWNFDLTVLAAVMAVIGYGLNDTIVISDRVRENFRLMRKQDTKHIINVSISQCIGRTLMTSITTLVVVFALQFLGGDTIHGFAVALSIGIVVSTWSSMYVANNVLLSMRLTKEDLMLPPKEEEGAEARP